MQTSFEYTHAKTIESNGMIAKIYRPVLTDAEHIRRMKKIYDAAENLLKAQERTKQ